MKILTYFDTPQFSSEAVEKSPSRFLGARCRKSYLIECATINDLMLVKSQVSSQTSFSLVKMTFSVDSLGE